MFDMSLTISSTVCWRDSRSQLSRSVSDEQYSTVNNNNDDNDTCSRVQTGVSGFSTGTRTRRTTLGDRAFSVTAARAWNALPSSVRSAPSLLQFRRDLNTALFQSSYSSP